MARKRNPTRYADEFYAEARELFGLGREDAWELRSLLEDAYTFDYREQSLAEYAAEAADLLDLLPGVQAEIEAQADYEYTEEAHREYEEGVRAFEAGELPTYEEGEEEYTESPYELDPEWPDDEWLEVGDWYEVTGAYKED